ncbi:MAG TPA: hypothetical protein ENK57_06195 [Polyangiaceae bacterium]|nr:hypothetical protein [Polyangiaceae bacterium]
MTPDRAATIFRELLQTPESELIHLPRRMGLQGHPTPPDLQQAKELLDALVVALQSGPGPNWDRVNTAWGAMVAKHGKLDKSAMGYAQPAWIRDLPPKPTLGDPAPGSPNHAAAQEQRQRFVPQAPPAPGYGGHQAGYPPPGTYSPPAVHAPPAIQNHHAPTQGSHATGPQGSQPPQGFTPSPAPTRAPAPTRPQPPPPPQRSAPHAAPAAQEGDIRNSVAKYASFCAACAAHPDRVFTTQVEYGITSPEMRASLDEDWQDRFDDDPQLHEKWEQLFRHFRKQLG